jgi:hypothetical protein
MPKIDLVWKSSSWRFGKAVYVITFNTELSYRQYIDRLHHTDLGAVTALLSCVICIPTTHHQHHLNHYFAFATAKLYTPPPFLVDSWFIPKLLVDS